MLYFYGALALTHIVAQVLFGHLNYRRQKKVRESKVFDGIFAPSVGIIVPVYNEDHDTLKRALDSMRWQNYAGVLRVYVVDDGSKNIEELERLYAYYEKEVGDTFTISRKENRGKRRAQVEALAQMARDKFKPEIVVTVDSDTVIASNGVKRIVQAFRDEEVGAATGHVLALNKDTNLLTRLINYRYWIAFNQERAAQSFFKVLMCCSGPFSAYRGNVIRGVAQKYVKQTFLGKVCTYGDDRHLTNLVLEEGWKVVYKDDAEANTHVPETLRAYLKQQLRWNKSFYREMLWTLKAIYKHNWYLLYDLIMQFILPFMLIVALAHSLYVIAFVNSVHVLAYISVVVIVGLLRVTYGLFRTKDLGFYWFLVYGFFHVFVLIPNRLIALATINDGKWGTR